MSGKGTLTFVSGENGFNAGTKAVADALTIASRCGWKVYKVVIPKPEHGLAARISVKARGFLNIMRCMAESGRIFLQYPISSAHYRGFTAMLLKRFGAKCTVLIHDLDSFRARGNFSEEVSFLKYAGSLIVHNGTMARKLAEAGLDGGRMRTLELFDYLCEKPSTIVRRPGTEICFAGNLDKSVFLRDLPAVMASRASVYLYGAPSANVRDGNGIRYMGKFSPGDISDIRGSWGLVWDGSGCNGLESPEGNYLRLNSPHKASLYVAAGLPVIVSAESAIAPYIVSHNLGICIGSLAELPERTAAVDAACYAAMTEAVKEEARMLTGGRHLSAALDCF